MENNNQIKFISFLVGIQGDSEFQVQTNVTPATLGDYIEASAGVDMNIIKLAIEAGGVEAVSNFLKVKEILMINSIRTIKQDPEQFGFTVEQAEELNKFFNIDEIESAIKENKEKQTNEILNAKTVTE